MSNVEAGRTASLEVYARFAITLGLSLEVTGRAGRHRAREQTDVVHATMGEIEAGSLGSHGYVVAIDHPCQHDQFAGRADVLAWTSSPPSSLHIENRTRFPDIQGAAGSYNAKRQYLAVTVAKALGIPRFVSETHVMVGLWSAEVIHAVRLRGGTFRALCPDGDERFRAWLEGDPPEAGQASSLVLLDPFARVRQARTIDLERVLAGARPRVRDYREAAERLRAEGRA